jgi:precorrin-2 methylase
MRRINSYDLHATTVRLSVALVLAFALIITLIFWNASMREEIQKIRATTDVIFMIDRARDAKLSEAIEAFDLLDYSVSRLESVTPVISQISEKNTKQCRYLSNVLEGRLEGYHGRN